MPALGISIVMVGASFFATLMAGAVLSGFNLILLALILAMGIAALVVVCAMTLVLRLEPASSRSPVLAEAERAPQSYPPSRYGRRTGEPAPAEPSAAAFT